MRTCNSCFLAWAWAATARCSSLVLLAASRSCIFSRCSRTSAGRLSFAASRQPVRASSCVLSVEELAAAEPGSLGPVTALPVGADGSDIIVGACGCLPLSILPCPLVAASFCPLPAPLAGLGGRILGDFLLARGDSGHCACGPASLVQGGGVLVVVA